MLMDLFQLQGLELHYTIWWKNKVKMEEVKREF